MPLNILELTMEHFEKGGDIMFPLLFISIVMWILIIKKSFDLSRNNCEESLTDCYSEAKRGKYNGTFWQKNIMKTFFGNKISSYENNSRLIDALITTEKKSIDKYSTTILILAILAPLLGLLGTVTGMINTFETIEKFGTGNARALAENISEALVTTQTGLIVSIPGLLIGNALNRKSEVLIEKMKCFGFGLLRLSDGEERSIGSDTF